MLLYTKFFFRLITYSGNNKDNANTSMLAKNLMVEMVLLIILLTIIGEKAYTDAVHSNTDATEK